MSKIIYTNPDGNLCVIHPIPGCNLTLSQVAAKDVPAGIPYKIVEDDAVPTDRTFRGAWESDMSDPHGVGADFGVGSTYAVIGWDTDGTPILRREA